MDAHVVVGLGNPGSRYAHTRHNVGFTLAEQLVVRSGGQGLERTGSYEAWQGRLVDGSELVVVAPLTFMNRSGRAVLEFHERHGLDLARTLVVVDDIDLPLGVLRLRPRGSSGGHRGLASIEEALGSREYARLRVGIGRDGGAVVDYVLAPFEESEADAVRDALGRAEEAVVTWAVRGMAAAMNAFNVSARAADTGSDEPPAAAEPRTTREAER